MQVLASAESEQIKKRIQGVYSSSSARHFLACDFYSSWVERKEYGEQGGSREARNEKFTPGRGSQVQEMRLGRDWWGWRCP